MEYLVLFYSKNLEIVSAIRFPPTIASGVVQLSWLVWVDDLIGRRKPKIVLLVNVAWGVVLFY